MSTLDRLVPGVWTFDPAHSEVGFVVRHAGISKVRGTFHDVSAEFVVGEQLEDSTLDAVIKTASVDTGDENRDGHLRTADFFDVESKPEMTFHATEFSLGGGEGTIEDLAGESRGRGFLERGGECASGHETLNSFLIGADIGGLQGEIEPPGRAIGCFG